MLLLDNLRVLVGIVLEGASGPRMICVSSNAAHLSEPREEPRHGGEGMGAGRELVE